MKRSLLLILAAVFALIAKADDRVLQVWQSDGQVVTISLNEEPRTTYRDGNLVITTTRTVITYPLEKVKRFTYASVADGITSPKTMTAAFSKDGETLTLTGLKPGTAIMMYNVAGQLLRKIDSGDRSKISVTASDLPTGVYVVKANDVTYKITKQ